VGGGVNLLITAAWCIIIFVNPDVFPKPTFDIPWVSSDVFFIGYSGVSLCQDDVTFVNFRGEISVGYQVLWLQMLKVQRAETVNTRLNFVP
jgi:hypothetical protein